jgi:hypothetical protein
MSMKAKLGQGQQKGFVPGKAPAAPGAPSKEAPSGPKNPTQ